MTRGNDLRTIGELDDRHMGRTVRIGALTGTLTGLIGCADRVQAVLIVGGSRVFTDALSADEHVEVWRRTGGAA